ncbi:UNVERIFIED_CONTAM: Cellulose synthase-like protein E6 [Sesamum indicum]
MSAKSGEVDVPPLFVTKAAKGRAAHRLLCFTIMVGIVLIWIYRLGHIPGADRPGRYAWVGLSVSEVLFGLYWVITQAGRWRVVYRYPFRDRLSSTRYKDKLPGVDVFVCTADPTLEPPMLVINTVLSVMSYNYPPEKLSVYLSDDGCSELTFYALLEASEFSKYWIPFCKKYNVEPRAPEIYFGQSSPLHESDFRQEWSQIKTMYEDMKRRIESAGAKGCVPREIKDQHKGFLEWDSKITKQDHQSIVQILIDGRDVEAKDSEGCRLPTLVYLAREKRSQHFHNFKAGAMNALIRVSSEISNGPIILNVDCDMYSNNSESIRDALCFFLDEEKGHDVAFVQFPQNFHNLTKNDLYGGSMRVINQIEFHGLDGCGGPMYIGTGCFHRRDTLCGRKFTKGSLFDWKQSTVPRKGETAAELEERVKELASCKFEKNTQWGKEMGLKYGCPVEDVITGLSIQCRGWKSVYFNPERKGFLGVAGTTLDQTLVQHKRWSEGDLQIFLSKHSPVWKGLGRINFGLIMGYCVYCLWSPNCFATLYYSIIPSVYLLKGDPLFPQVSSFWVLPFVYVIIGEHACSLAEYLWSGGTVLGWWNGQRMWLYKRTSSYLFAAVDTLLKLVGYSDSGFVISAKVSDKDVSQRYKQEKMEFGAVSPMFTLLSSLAMFNLFCLALMVMKVIRAGGLQSVNETMVLQILLCGTLVLINLPLYSAAFFRKDKGRMPSSVTLKSILVALLLCSCYAFL